MQVDPPLEQLDFPAWHAFAGVQAVPETHAAQAPSPHTRPAPQD
jgi:hypothetical protein